MIAKTIAVLFTLGVAAAWDKPFAGVDPNTLSCDPEGQVFLLLPHEEDCTLYYQCAHGREILMPGCSAPLIFDFELQGCNWERDATCILRTPPGEEDSEDSEDQSKEEEEEAEEDGEAEGEEEVEEEEAEGEGEAEGEEVEEEDASGEEEAEEEEEEDSGNVGGEGSGDEVEEGSGDGIEEEIEIEEDIDGSGSGSGDLGESTADDTLPITAPFDILAHLHGLMQGVKPVPAPVQSASFSAFLDCRRADSAAKHIPYKGDCQRFWRCVGGVAHTFYCSDGLFFNERTQMCDFEANIPCLANNEDELEGEFIVYK